MEANELIENLIAKVDSVKKSGDGYIGRCPAHADSEPSLSFGLSKAGKLLLYCHAGCTLDAIAIALGLDKATLLHGLPAGHKKRRGKGPGRPKKSEAIPAGQYLCRLLSVREETKSDGSPQWSVKFLVAAGPHKGEGWIFDTWRFDAEGLPHVKHACGALGLDVTASQETELHPSALEGRTCTLTVEEYEYEGLRRNRITRPGGYAAAAEKTYDYHDADGTLLYQVVRLEPKAFYQRRPNQRGGWIYNLDGVRRVPYLLPSLISSPPDAALFVCEGEKDCERLAACGLLATTNPQGAGKWSKLDEEAVARAFKDRRVFVLPDNDEPGAKHGREVAAALERIASEVRVVELPGLPAKGDVSDWFTLSPENTPSALLALCEAVAPWRSSASPDGEDTGHVITNYETEEYEDADGAAKTDYIRIPISRILRSILFACNGWPRRLGNQLFYDNAGEIAFLDSEDAVFAYLHTHAEIRWMGKSDSAGRNYVTRGEVVSALSNQAPCIDEITETPMHPEPKRVYVTRSIPKSGSTDGSHFAKLLKFFRPATVEDQALLCALMLTPFWGGPAGGRPLIVLTGPEGIGQQETGKTSTAIYATAAAGSYFQLKIDRNSSVDPPAKQLLSDTALRSRVVLVDNLVGVTDSSDLAELITLPTFDGRPAFGRPRRRLNYLTWVATAVSPQFTRDLSSRSYVVHLTVPNREAWPTWEEEIRTFITEERDRIVADALSHLRGEKCKLTAPPSRFPAWDREVLACHESANKALLAKVTRERAIDSEDEELALFLMELRAEGAGKYEEELPPSKLTEIWNKATGRKLAVSWVIRKLNEYRAKGRLPDAVRPKWRVKSGGPWIVTYRAINVEDDHASANKAGEAYASPGEASF